MMQPVKARTKEEKALSPAFTYEVLVAETGQALIKKAGLSRVEKRLFQQVGLLPHSRLWQTVGEAEPPDLEASDTSEATQAVKDSVLDLEGISDRGRRRLQSIAALARQGKLGPMDTDLLLEIARRLSRHAG